MGCAVSECYCDDGERPDVYHVAQIKARVRHKCYECSGEIYPGETYERVAMLYEGSWDVAKTCCKCLDLRQYVTAHAPCFCWLHGSMCDDAQAVIDQHGHESFGFYIGAMKRLLRTGRRGHPTPNA